jgi:hypothetical protein
MPLTEVETDLWLVRVVVCAAAAAAAVVAVELGFLLWVHVTQWKARTCSTTNTAAAAAAGDR